MDVTKNLLTLLATAVLAVGCGREFSQHRADYSALKSDAEAAIASQEQKQQQLKLEPVKVDQKKLDELLKKIEPQVQAYYDSAGKLMTLAQDKDAKKEDVKAALKDTIEKIEAIVAALDPILKPAGVTKDSVLVSAIWRNGFATSFSKSENDEPFLVLGITATADKKGKVTGFDFALAAPKKKDQK